MSAVHPNEGGRVEGADVGEDDDRPPQLLARQGADHPNTGDRRRDEEC